MFEAALALTTALALVSGAKPGMLRKAFFDVASQKVMVLDMPAPLVCRMPVLPSETAPSVDQRFMVVPKPTPHPAKMPSAGKLLPCPAVGKR